MSGPSILIVEDEGIAAVNLEQKITELGYKSAGIAFTAEEAYGMARTRRPDLILLDIQLRGGTDGIQFAENLKSEIDVPVVFVSAYSDDFTIQRAKQTLAFGYLIKPLREETIRSTVEMALQKHRYERELRRSQLRFRAVFEKSRTGICVAGRDNRISMANTEAAVMFGISVDDLRGTDLTRLLQISGPSDPGLERGVVCTVVRTPMGPGWVKVTRDVFDEQGEGEASYIYYFEDITEQKLKEQRLIEGKVSAERGLQHRQELIAYLGHELQTPLSSMIGYADLLHGMQLGEKERRIFLQRIRSSGEYLSTFLSEILEFSKMELGGVELRPARLCLSDLLNDVLSLLNVQADSKGLSLGVEVDLQFPLFIQSDARILKHVLINVVGNAIKFTDRGAVKIFVRLDSGQAVIEVVDTGCGVAPDDRESIFEPFSQATSQIRKRYGGTGLGLSMSKRLAESLGGSLALSRTEIGAGSTFSLRFPI